MDGYVNWGKLYKTFSTGIKTAVTPKISNSKEIKSDFNSKMLIFNVGFTSY